MERITQICFVNVYSVYCVLTCVPQKLLLRKRKVQVLKRENIIKSMNTVKHYEIGRSRTGYVIFNMQSTVIRTATTIMRIMQTLLFSTQIGPKASLEFVVIRNTQVLICSLKIKLDQ